MDYLRHVPPQDLGYLDQVSPNLPDAQIPIAAITWPTNSLYTRLRPDWM